ncbi:hypothetical protein ABZW44_26025 [Streptomyces mirabilis]|uniref:hypothetical protein n=1 Tax=Streptomyces mirabilis TaxID=68239 RepID=UPI0033334BDE
MPCDDAGRRLWHLATPYLWRHAARHALGLATVRLALLKNGVAMRFSRAHTTHR